MYNVFKAQSTQNIVSFEYKLIHIQIFCFIYILVIDQNIVRVHLLEII